MMTAFLIIITIEIVFITLEKNNSACILVSEQGNGIISLFLKIAETDYVSECLHRVQDPVRPGKGLDQAMHLQVLINPQRVQRSRIEARKEHIHDNEDINLLGLHLL